MSETTRPDEPDEPSGGDGSYVNPHEGGQPRKRKRLPRRTPPSWPGSLHDLEAGSISYMRAGAIQRQANQRFRALEGRGNGSDYRVLTKIEDLTTAYSKRADAVFLSLLFATTPINADRGAASLKKLVGLGIVELYSATTHAEMSVVALPDVPEGWDDEPPHDEDDPNVEPSPTDPPPSAPSTAVSPEQSAADPPLLPSSPSLTL